MNTVVCRESYVDGDAMNKHLENAGLLLGKLLDGVVSMHVEGLEEELPRSKLEWTPWARLTRM